MNRNQKVIGALLAGALFVMALPKAWADADNSNNNAAITITINPNVDIGVTVSSANTTLTYSVTPGATQYFVDAATVTVAGDLSPQEWDIQGFNLDTWTLAADDVPGLNIAQLYGLFAVGRASAPVAAEFEVGDPTQNLIHGGGETRAGGGGGAGTFYEQSGGPFLADVDSMNVGTSRQVWFRLDAPSNNNVSAAQKFQVRITATTTGL